MKAERIFDDNQAVWLDGAAPEPEATPLPGDATVDVAIIGGGFTGVSTAYHLSRRFTGLGVMVLEAKRLANGASGRNGGMMLNGVTDTDEPDALVREHELMSGAMERAMNLDEEPPALRERYGMNIYGQRVLLARRLMVESEYAILLGWPDALRRRHGPRLFPRRIDCHV